MLAVALLLLAACGNGDDDTDDTDETGATEPADTDTDANGGRGLAALTDSDCRQYAQAFQEVPNIADPGSLGSIGELAEIMDDAAERVPNEISGDFRVLADAYREFSDALGDSDIDFTDPASFATLDPEDLQALERAGEAFGSAEITMATQNINTFLTENCT